MSAALVAMPCAPAVRPGATRSSRRRARAAVRTTQAAGFTLIELLTTLAVLAVSLALAAPSLAGFMRSNRVRAAQSELVSSLLLARGEAARRGLPVGVEAKAAVADGGLARGWRVWVDADGNGVYDTGETRLRDVTDLGAGVTITSKRGTTDVRSAVFSPRGFLMPLAQLSLSVCGQSGEKGYGVRLEPAGLADVAEVAACP